MLYRKLAGPLRFTARSRFVGMLVKNCPEPLEASDEAMLRGSSTPHRIKMPSLEEELLQNGCKRRAESDKRKAAGAALGALQQQQPNKLAKLPGVRGRKPLVRPVVHPKVITANHKLTEYFPVRRSVRKCKKAVLEERQRDLENKVMCGVEDGLQVENARSSLIVRPLLSRGA